jgi:hypothetical protein
MDARANGFILTSDGATTKSPYAARATGRHCNGKRGGVAAKRLRQRERRGEEKRRREGMKISAALFSLLLSSFLLSLSPFLLCALCNPAVI